MPVIGLRLKSLAIRHNTSRKIDVLSMMYPTYGTIRVFCNCIHVFLVWRRFLNFWIIKYISNNFQITRTTITMCVLTNFSTTNGTLTKTKRLSQPRNNSLRINCGIKDDLHMWFYCSYYISFVDFFPVDVQKPSPPLNYTVWFNNWNTRLHQKWFVIPTILSFIVNSTFRVVHKLVQLYH